MFFNSIEFLLFFPSVTLLFYLTPKKFRWLPLLVANYFFYSMIKIEYLAIIIFQTMITFLGAIAVHKQSDSKLKFRFFLLTLMINILTLVFFKYTDFVLESFVNLIKVFYSGANEISLGIILPLGISFYTLQIIGYLTDVYWEQIEPERHFGKFAVFVSFFPPLLAGPIERADRVMPQIHHPVSFKIDNIIKGSKLFLVGMFYKVVVADRLSIYVNTIYGNSDSHGGGSFILASLFFTIQIYGDFAGYSLMALGCAKALGINIMNNFNHPYFSKSISEFWNRWHISLSTWLRDYIFTPLTYNRLFGVRFDSYRVELSVIITFLISGLWHGANWNFIFWGFLNGLFIVIGLKSKMFRKGIIDRFGLNSKIFTVFIPWIFTFVLLNVMWIFFRSDSIMMGFGTIIKIVTSPTSFFIGSRAQIFYSLVAVFLLIIYELLKFFGFDEEKTILRSSVFYITLFFLIILIGVFNGSQFIYFQF